MSNSKARNPRCTIDLPSNTALCRIPPPGVTILLSDSQHGPLSFAKTPHDAILVHVTFYAVSLYVIALDFGEAQPRRETWPHLPAPDLRP